MLHVSVWSTIALAAYAYTSSFIEILVEEGAMREERASAGMVVVFWKNNKHHTERTEYPFFIYCILCLKDGLNSSLQPPQTHTLFSFPDSYGCTAKGTPYFGA